MKRRVITIFLCACMHFLMASYLPAKTLVILTGTIRGSEIAHKSLERHLLLPCDADLFLCTEASEDRSSYLHRLATYLAEYPHVEDPRIFADLISYKLFGHTRWRQYPPNFLGSSLLGIYDEQDHWTGRGAGLLTLCVRRLALDWLEKEGLLDKYDQFVISRTDFYYVADHPNIPSLLAKNHHIAIPFVSSQGWIPDRHAVTDKIGLVAYLKAVDLFLECSPIFDGRNLYSMIPYQTIEHVLYTALYYQHHLPPFRYIAPQYAVRADDDETPTWCAGEKKDSNGLWIKAESDYREAQLYLKLYSDCTK